MKIMRHFFTYIFFIITISACSQPGLFKETRILMDTFCEISCYSQDKIAIKMAFEEIERIERLCSKFDEKSELSKVNTLAGQEEVVISEELLELISRSIYYSNLTQGAFDVTKQGKYKSIALDKDKSSIRFVDSDIKIDLGGIAKGYAVDRAVQVLRNHDIENALVNLGGNMFALGSPAGRKAWRIGIRDPGDKSKIIHKLNIKDKAVSTSANYERPSHIINPITGNPAKDIGSVTIVAPSAEQADALSTAVFITGKDLCLNDVEVYIYR
ncbi:MAG: FAD:protein FMN transferase [Candidatus Omnitrophica bacterium]|nr:FAD:protein FMN transferase [Candidatus Omnitrophota bacterium]